MSIQFACEQCGKSFSVKDELAGRKAKCKCGHVFTVPQPGSVEEEDDIFGLKEDAPVPAAASRVSAPVAHPPARGASPAAKWEHPVQPVAKVNSSAIAASTTASPDTSIIRRFAYVFLLLALIPLAWSTISPSHFDLKQALHKTVLDHPEIAPKLVQTLNSKTATEDDLFNVLPDHKLEGAWLPHDTYQHWLYALLSSAIFTTLILFIFPRSTESLGRMLLVGLFTATIGIVLLLAFQWIAEWTQHFWITGHSVIVLLFYIVKFIGFSYRAAMDPSNGFVLSALGFTFGVGLCEELCKAAPVLLHYHTKGDWPWRTACLVGLISGVGFGVSEAITYSSDFYNGASDGRMYLVRFISCVALHAVWAGSSAIFIFRHRNLLHEQETIWGTMIMWMAMVSAPMLLHGMYDTLLKKEMDGWALATALVSFAWFAWQIERARRDFDTPAPEPARPRFGAVAA